MAELGGRCPGPLRSLCALAGVVVGLIYVANLGVASWELVPDGAPLVGNLDEAAATLLLAWGLVTLFRRRGA